MESGKLPEVLDKDIDFVAKNWKEIPVISTQVLMKTFPYVLPPWEHWNQIIDTLKNIEKDSECVSKKEYTPTSVVKINEEFDEESINNEDITRDSSTIDPGYSTDVSEISDDEYIAAPSDVDWESDADF